MHGREPRSFWRENMVALVILQRVLGQSGEYKLSNVRSLIILRLGEGVTSFTKGNTVVAIENW